MTDQYTASNSHTFSSEKLDQIASVDVFALLHRWLSLPWLKKSPNLPTASTRPWDELAYLRDWLSHTGTSHTCGESREYFGKGYTEKSSFPTALLTHPIVGQRLFQQNRGQFTGWNRRKRRLVGNDTEMNQFLLRNSSIPYKQGACNLRLLNCRTTIQKQFQRWFPLSASALSRGYRMVWRPGYAWHQTHDAIMQLKKQVGG